MGGSSDSVTMYLLLDENSSVTAGEITAQIAELTKDMDCRVDTDNSASDMSSFLGSGITVQIKGSDLAPSRNWQESGRCGGSTGRNGGCG